jgi:hypothetical protein
MLVTSDPSAGATNLSADGSSFNIVLDEPLTIPYNAINITIAVEQSTVWWVIPNIIQNVNDKLYITCPNVANVLTNYVVTITQGLYDLTSLNTSIQTELESQGAKIDPEPVISFNPDSATQRVSMRFAYPSMSVDFTQPQTFREILGFDPLVYQNLLIAPFSILAPNVASFNQVNYFLIHSDLCSRGIRFNGNYNQTISQVLINVPPGSQIVYAPFNPAIVTCPDLAGIKRTRVKFWLTDDKDRLVNTNSEYWSARLTIKYLIPITI